MKKLLLGVVLVLSACSIQVDEYDGFQGEVALVQLTQAEFDQALLGDAVIILADPSSEWSQQAVPVFNEAVKQITNQAYYYNASEERGNEELLARIQAATFTDELSKLLYDELYLPIVIRVEEGFIRQVHLGTVSSHVISEGVIPSLTTEQKAELQSIYEALLEQTS
jgi:hypothetical protein